MQSMLGMLWYFEHIHCIFLSCYFSLAGERVIYRTKCLLWVAFGVAGLCCGSDEYDWAGF